MPLDPRHADRPPGAPAPGPDIPAPDVAALYRPGFRLRGKDRIASLGGGFAPDVTQALRDSGFRLLEVEPPLPGMSDALARRYGYGLFSARTGPIGTARQFLQLVRDAQAATARPQDMYPRDAGWFDGLRADVDPHGLPSREAALAARLSHLRRVRRMLAATDVLILTLDGTQAWEDPDTGTVYPGAAPFDPARHRPRSLTGADILADLSQVRDRLRGLSPGLRMIVMASPAAQADTQSDTLRAACRAFGDGHADAACFPAPEIAGAGQGTQAVMAAFRAAHPPPANRAARRAARRARAQPDTVPPPAPLSGEDDARCAEILREAFAGGTAAQ